MVNVPTSNPVNERTRGNERPCGQLPEAQVDRTTEEGPTLSPQQRQSVTDRIHDVSYNRLQRELPDRIFELKVKHFLFFKKSVRCI